MKTKLFLKDFTIFIITSLFFTALFVVIFYSFLEDRISPYISIFNTMIMKDDNINSKRLVSYPKFGSKYANLSIDSIHLKLPIYYGDTKKNLRHGVGHYVGSYFPGENGTIIYAAHNNPGYFDKLDKVKIGDKVFIQTNYDVFEYKVYLTKIVKETDLNAFNVQFGKEVLIMYTCWPIDRDFILRKKERLVVYAERIGDNNQNII